jgi:phosphoserine aminotransferase
MRKWNFCAGPAAIPEEVLRDAQNELLEWNLSGSSVMEVSHRSDLFAEVAVSSTKDIKALLNIGDDHEVLFLQGGATLQFTSIPLNFTKNSSIVSYLNTGLWSKKAIKAASKYASVNVVASSEESNFTFVPNTQEWRVDPDSIYFHYVMNETIQGLAKNIGPAGLTLVIIKKDFLEKANEDIPDILSYKKNSQAGSMLNTPPTFAWYLAGKVFKWLLKKGGVKGIQKENEKKAKFLYDFIDSSSFYSNPVEKEHRSIMNVPFLLNDKNADSSFLEKSEMNGLLNLKGHRSVGGMRASIYNATPFEAVEDLVSFMSDFERSYNGNGK